MDHSATIHPLPFMCRPFTNDLFVREMGGRKPAVVVLFRSELFELQLVMAKVHSKNLLMSLPLQLNLKEVGRQRINLH